MSGSRRFIGQGERPFALKGEDVPPGILVHSEAAIDRPALDTCNEHST
jgi:hypothetical protein